MISIQHIFDRLITLLEAQASTYTLAQKCLDDCNGELAFTPANENADGTSPEILAQLFLHNGDDGANDLVERLRNSAHNRLHLWYIDTENGGYTIITDAQVTTLAGIVKTAKTLTDIRKAYFRQKETLERIGEKPLYDYEQKENTFVNRKLVV